MLPNINRTKADLLKGIDGVTYSKKVDRNTVMYRLADGTECVKYHDTIVVKKSPKGVITLNSGGFRTPTTKKRFWQYGKIDVSQKNSVWYMSDGSAFYDGIQVIAGSEPSNTNGWRQEYRVVSKVKKSNNDAVRKMKARIVKYVNLIAPTNLPVPSAGDCFYCLMRDVNTGKTMGDTVGRNPGDTHLLSHLKEGYIVGSLLVNAMRENGYTDKQIGLSYHGAQQGDKWYLSIIRRAVVKYLQKRLLPGINVTEA